MKIINLTSFDVSIVENGKEILSIPASGELAYCEQKIENLDPVEIDGVNIPSGFNKYTKIVGLPEKEEGTLLFVLSNAADVAWKKGRNDVVSYIDMIMGEETNKIVTSGLKFMPEFPYNGEIHEWESL